jgi:hypothetical protein
MCFSLDRIRTKAAKEYAEELMNLAPEEKETLKKSIAYYSL